jgi:hypothetical protein
VSARQSVPHPRLPGSGTQNCNYRPLVEAAKITTVSGLRRNPAVTKEEAAVDEPSGCGWV